MATLPGGQLPPPPPPPGPQQHGFAPPGYGYPHSVGYVPAAPSPWHQPDAPAPRPRPSWTTAIVLSVVTAVVASFGTLVLVNDHTRFELSNGPAVGQPAVGAPTVVEPTVVAPTVADAGAAADAEMADDLKTASIAEQSWAVDNNGKFVADIVRPTGSPNDPLVQQGLTLRGPVVLTATLFADPSLGGQYCLTVVSSATPKVWYLSSVDDVVTLVKPTGCA
jgi:hypothetical protein